MNDYLPPDASAIGMTLARKDASIELLCLDLMERQSERNNPRANGVGGRSPTPLAPEHGDAK